MPDYLGSKSTFTLGQFGGHGGRALRAGDVLHLAELADNSHGASLPPELRTDLPAVRSIRVIYGPHARRNTSPRPTSRPSSPPTGKCTSTPAAPAYG